MGYGAPIQVPMYIEAPPAELPSPFRPELEEKPLPALADTSVEGIRLHGTLAKALPPMKKVDVGNNTRAMAAAEYARDVRASYDISKAQKARSRAIAKLKGQRSDKAAKNFGLR